MQTRSYAALALASTLLLGLTLWAYREPSPSPSSFNRNYTYIGDDYPLQWPLPDAVPVYMYPEDTHRYALSTPSGAAEWRALVPPSNGTVRLGPRGRAFTVAMFHQLQCLDVIRAAMASPVAPGDARRARLRDHCLDYMRQTVLCHAHTDLESVRSDVGPKIADLTRSVYRCRDWRVLYDAMDAGDAAR